MAGINFKVKGGSFTMIPGSISDFVYFGQLSQYAAQPFFITALIPKIPCAGFKNSDYTSSQMSLLRSNECFKIRNLGLPHPHYSYIPHSTKSRKPLTSCKTSPF